MREFEKTVEKLCAASRANYGNPYEDVEWPSTLDPEQWFTTPELITLYGTDTYTHLTEPQKKRLSFYEAVNFFSLNIHGERALVAGLAERLYSVRDRVPSDYLHHFLDEENKHMVYFGGFCMRYAGKVYPDRKVVFPRSFAPGEEDFLFFAKVLIFEEIVDAYNTRMSMDENLVPIARQINLMHHRDESRHLVFGRQMVKELFTHSASQWSAETHRAIREYLKEYIIATWQEYYNPDVYRDARLGDPFTIREEALQNPQCRQHRQRITEGCLRYLLQNGILDEEISL